MLESSHVTKCLMQWSLEVGVEREAVTFGVEASGQASADAITSGVERLQQIAAHTVRITWPRAVIKWIIDRGGRNGVLFGHGVWSDEVLVGCAYGSWLS